MRTQKTSTKTISPQEAEQRQVYFQMAMSNFIAALDGNCIIASKGQMCAMLQSAREYPMVANLKHHKIMQSEIRSMQTVIGVFKSCVKYIQNANTQIEFISGNSMNFSCEDFKLQLSIRPYGMGRKVIMIYGKS
jgi:hypothetical protein